MKKTIKVRGLTMIKIFGINYTRPIPETHFYNVNVAMDVGLNAAVLFQNICYWVAKNRANGKNERDGKFWTYNSMKAFSELLPELSETQIKHSIKKLKEKGYILTGNFNENPYDHTTWYTLSDSAERFFLACPIVQTNLSNQEATKLSERSEKKVNSTNTDINTNRNANRNSSVEKPDDVSSEVWEDWRKLRKAQRAPITPLVLKNLKREGDKAGMSLEDVMTYCVTNGYRGFKADWVSGRKPVQSKKTEAERNFDKEYFF